MTERDPIQAALAALKDDDYVAAEYVDFRLGLLEAQHRLLASIPPLEVLRGTTFPLIPDQVPLEPDLLPPLVAWFQAAAGEEEQSAEFARLAAWGGEDPSRLARLARMAGLGDDPAALATLAEELEVGHQVLAFVGRSLLSPFLLAFRTRLAESGLVPAAASGACPVCGNPPALGVLDADPGRRRLGCSLCGHRWDLSRLVCPDCGNADEERLGSLSLNPEDPRWLEVCDRCRGYLKTVDGRRLPEPISCLVEEVRTLHLDILAVKEGYETRPPYTSLV